MTTYTVVTHIETVEEIEADSPKRAMEISKTRMDSRMWLHEVQCTRTRRHVDVQ